MFDNIVVKKQLPLTEELSSLGVNWAEESFQTKDLENLLENYEIREDGKLWHHRQEREWKKDESSILGGYMDVVSECWEEVPFHGVVKFYTSLCDNPDLDSDLLFSPEKMTWEEVVLCEGFDWWIEFSATFDRGILREMSLEKAEKTPIRVRLAANKEWGMRQAEKNRRPLRRVVSRLRKIPAYRMVIRSMARLEQKTHEKVSSVLRGIS